MVSSVWHPNQERNFQILSGLRVLVVDSNTDSLELTAFIFGDYQAQVIAVNTAIEALGAITQSVPDILISEISLPELDGYSLIRLLRTLPPQKGGLIPAIALTARATYKEHTLALDAGFSRHVSKPVDPDKLVAVVSELAFRSLSSQRSPSRIIS